MGPEVCVYGRTSLCKQVRGRSHIYAKGLLDKRRVHSASVLAAVAVTYQQICARLVGRVIVPELQARGLPLSYIGPALAAHWAHKIEAGTATFTSIRESVRFLADLPEIIKQKKQARP